MEKVKLSSPWQEFFNELEALFAADDDVKLSFDDGEEKKIILRVNGEEKASALSKLLPEEKVFGNVSVCIEVVPSNDGDREIDLFRDAFSGNPAVSFIKTVPDPYGNKVDFVVFQNKVVQFFNDNMADINGNKSTLFEDIARDVFDGAGVFFCTDTESKVIG